MVPIDAESSQSVWNLLHGYCDSMGVAHHLLLALNHLTGLPALLLPPCNPLCRGQEDIFNMEITFLIPTILTNEPSLQPGLWVLHKLATVVCPITFLPAL